jgi:hypothetical protein
MSVGDGEAGLRLDRSEGPLVTRSGRSTPAASDVLAGESPTRGPAR